MALEPCISTYFGAWDSRDPEGIVASLAPNGTYEDPNTQGPISGTALHDYAAALFSAFPDLAFASSEPVGTGENVAVPWHMTGTNTGSMRGLPPTGRAVAVPGADFFKIADAKIVSVRGFFDPRTVPEQVGLQVLVMPRVIGQFTFGTSIRIHSGSLAKPTSYSTTVLWTSPEDSVAIGEQAKAIAVEMLNLRGAISVMLIVNGDRRITITAWERPEDARAVRQMPMHKTALEDFFSTDGLSKGGYIGSWQLQHQSPLRMRCPSCSSMNDVEQARDQCKCGNAFNDLPAYW